MITGVGSERFGGEDGDAEPNSEGVMSGGGDGAKVSMFMIEKRYIAEALVL